MRQLTLFLVIVAGVGCSAVRPKAIVAQPGDVLAVHDPWWDPVADIIRFRTNSHWDHIAVVINSNTVFDALPGGCAYRPLQRYESKEWLLLRPSVALDASQISALSFWCDQHNGWGYDYWGMWGFLSGQDSSATEGSLFCSKLVFEAYNKAGLLLVPRRWPGLIPPELIVQSLAFATQDTNAPSLLKLSLR